MASDSGLRVDTVAGQPVDLCGFDGHRRVASRKQPPRSAEDAQADSLSHVAVVDWQSARVNETHKRRPTAEAVIDRECARRSVFPIRANSAASR